jgi:hypothetical protein
MRTLKLYGTNNAEYKVFINDKQSQSFDSDLIYNFSTDTTFHGSYNVKIEVIKGSLTLEKCLVDYPATLNGKKGIMTMDQPIETPLYIWTGEKLVAQPFPITINNGETVEFEHLMFNGATFFKVDLKDEVEDKVYVGNLITRNYNPILRDIQPIFEYDPEDWNFWSKESLQKLVDVVTKKLTTEDKEHIIVN